MAEPGGIAADLLIAAARKRTLRAYWLDAVLLAGLVALGVGVWRAIVGPSQAAVIVSDLRKGEPVKPEHVGFATLAKWPRAVTRNQKLDGYVAARDLEPGTPLRWSDVVKPRPRAAQGELELPLRLFVGTTPPKADERVLLGVVASEHGDTIVVAARVLAVDTLSDPASVTMAIREHDAVRLATIPKPQIQLMHRTSQEQKR